MRRLRDLVAGAALVCLLTACTAPGPSASNDGAFASSPATTDAGNERPVVTYDGLMVRRRAVLAVLPGAETDVALLRRALDASAARHGTALADVPPDVLDPALLEEAVPELTLVLPDGKTTDDAAALLDTRLARDEAFPGRDRFTVASALVHDVTFVVSTSEPAALAEAIAREGIVSDALGNYDAMPSADELRVEYTGPLLSDHLVESVRGGIARAAGLAAAAVIVFPRSTSGVGVDMSAEPGPASAAPSSSHGHASPAVAAPAGPSIFWIAAISVGAAWAAAVALLLIRRMRLARRSATRSTWGY